MGATAMVANSTIRLSPGWNAIYYWGVWAICIICIGIILWAALKSPKWARWTTQDILIVAALGVLLEVYDNIIGDQVIGCVVLVTVPLLIGTLRGTTTMAMVADARGFGASKKRGSLRIHKTTAVDIRGYAILAVLVVGALVLNHLGIGARYYG